MRLTFNVVAALHRRECTHSHGEEGGEECVAEDTNNL